LDKSVMKMNLSASAMRRFAKAAHSGGFGLLARKRVLRKLRKFVLGKSMRGLWPLSRVWAVLGESRPRLDRVVATAMSREYADLSDDFAGVAGDVPRARKKLAPRRGRR
jgi:hypothetical protein